MPWNLRLSIWNTPILSTTSPCWALASERISVRPTAFSWPNHTKIMKVKQEYCFELNFQNPNIGHTWRIQGDQVVSFKDQQTGGLVQSSREGKNISPTLSFIGRNGAYPIIGFETESIVIEQSQLPTRNECFYKMGQRKYHMTRVHIKQNRQEVGNIKTKIILRKEGCNSVSSSHFPTLFPRKIKPSRSFLETPKGYI